MENLKNLIKSYVFWIASGIAFILGFIYYLIGENRGLKEQVRQTEAEKGLAKTLAKKEQIDEKAGNAVSDYEHARDEYRKSRSDV